MPPETLIDKKGRIVIPRPLREKLKLHAGAKVRLVPEEGKIIIMRPTTVQAFIREMKGCIKEGLSVAKINPLDLKKI